jgi:hypothetical protein
VSGRLCVLLLAGFVGVASFVAPAPAPAGAPCIPVGSDYRQGGWWAPDGGFVLAAAAEDEPIVWCAP